MGGKASVAHGIALLLRPELEVGSPLDPMVTRGYVALWYTVKHGINVGWGADGYVLYARFTTSNSFSSSRRRVSGKQFLITANYS